MKKKFFNFVKFYNIKMFGYFFLGGGWLVDLFWNKKWRKELYVVLELCLIYLIDNMKLWYDINDNI